jgi:hypothetical protein
LLTALALALVLLLPRPAAADLLVVSTGTNEVLRYDGATGAFIDAFVTAGSGGLVDPSGITFGPDGTSTSAAFLVKCCAITARRGRSLTPLSRMAAAGWTDPQA